MPQSFYIICEEIIGIGADSYQLRCVLAGNYQLAANSPMHAKNLPRELIYLHLTPPTPHPFHVKTPHPPVNLHTTTS